MSGNLSIAFSVLDQPLMWCLSKSRTMVCQKLAFMGGAVLRVILVGHSHVRGEAQINLWKSHYAVSLCTITPLFTLLVCSSKVSLVSMLFLSCLTVCRGNQRSTSEVFYVREQKAVEESFDLSKWKGCSLPFLEFLFTFACFQLD